MSYNVGHIPSSRINSMESPGTSPMGTVTYNRAAAVAYARQFTSESTGTASYNNIGFNAVRNGGDCANFISQCLFAGGIPQTDVWYYRTPYTRSGKRTSAWTGTVSMRNFLEGREWVAKLSSPLDLRRGDIVYTYKSEESLPHIVIVTEDVDSDGLIFICGHTMNQLDAIRGLQSSVYYHINDIIPIQANDIQYVGYTDSDDFQTAMSDFGTMDLSIGSTGTNVSNLQLRLVYLGYYTGDIQCTYDTATASAVRAFQAAYHIPSDGVAGRNTKSMLYIPASRFI